MQKYFKSSILLKRNSNRVEPKNMLKVFVNFLLILAVGFIIGGNAQEEPKKEKQYKVTNEKVEILQGDTETLVHFDHLQIITQKRLRYVNGSITFGEDMDDFQWAFDVDLESSPQNDGNYKKTTMYVPPTKICEGFRRVYREFVQPSFNDEKTNIPFISEDGICPIPAGEYYFKEITFNTDSWPDEFPKGMLRVTIKFYKNNVCVGGMIGYLDISEAD